MSFIRLLFGVPMVLAGLLLGILAVVGVSIDSTNAGRMVAVVLAVVSLLLIFFGARLCVRGRSSRGRIRPISRDSAFVDFDPPDAIPVDEASEYSGGGWAIADTGPNQVDRQSKPFVRVDENGQIYVNVQTVAEARIAINELRLLKKALSLRKREVNNTQQAIRAEYSDHVRRRGSKVVGGGWLGRLARMGQTVSRDNDRAELANALEPLELKKQRIQSALNAVDLHMTKLEAYIIQCR